MTYKEIEKLASATESYKAWVEGFRAGFYTAQSSQKNELHKHSVRRSFYCLKCKNEVDYTDEDIDIMERAEENEGIFCSAECEHSFNNGGDGCDY